VYIIGAGIMLVKLSLVQPRAGQNIIRISKLFFFPR